MKCARCNADLPVQSRFCLRCGTPVPTGPAHAAEQPRESSGQFAAPFAPARPANRGMKIAVLLLVLAVAGLGAMIIKGGLLHSPGRSDDGSLVNDPGRSGMSSLVQAPGQSKNSPLIQNPGMAQAPPNPAQQPGEAAPRATDVEDYLRFLKEVERKKMALIREFTTSALLQSANEKQQEVNAASSDEASNQFLPNINKGNEDFAPRWDELAKYFLTKDPPASCRDLQQKYYSHLGKIEAMFTALHNALAEASTDPSKALSALTGMQGTASAEADDSARLSDDALADVCDKYHLRKEFDIRTDPSSGTGLLR